VLVNTTDGHERELLADWLEERGVRATPAALGRARQVREAFRRLLIANNHHRPVPAGAAAKLEVAAQRSRLSVRFAPTARLAAGADGVDGALGPVLVAAFEAMQDGSWSRLKACRNCHWAFYDESRNRSAAWCSMQLCGNRLKTAAYRHRRREAVA
jgi:predicted RNA-binding Zn ribbon-like protein